MTDSINKTQGDDSGAAAQAGGAQAGSAVQAGGAAQADIEAANKQIADLTETAKRALADLQNYRKRVEEERAAFVVFANASLLLDLLPVLDNFNRAFSQVPEDVSKTEWFKGALQIEQQLVSIIKKQGVAEMPSSIGKKLDLKFHEPLMTGPGEKDAIIEELEKGYMLGDRVLRPAKVKVGDGSAAVSS